MLEVIVFILMDLQSLLEWTGTRIMHCTIYGVANAQAYCGEVSQNYIVED